MGGARGGGSGSVASELQRAPTVVRAGVAWCGCCGLAVEEQACHSSCAPTHPHKHTHMYHHMLPCPHHTCTQSQISEEGTEVLPLDYSYMAGQQQIGLQAAPPRPPPPAAAATAAAAAAGVLPAPHAPDRSGVGADSSSDDQQQHVQSSPPAAAAAPAAAPAELAAGAQQAAAAAAAKQPGGGALAAFDEVVQDGTPPLRPPEAAAAALAAMRDPLGVL
jgi:hypothetical protein